MTTEAWLLVVNAIVGAQRGHGGEPTGGGVLQALGDWGFRAFRAYWALRTVGAASCLARAAATKVARVGMEATCVFDAIDRALAEEPVLAKKARSDRMADLCESRGHDGRGRRGKRGKTWGEIEAALLGQVNVPKRTAGAVAVSGADVFRAAAHAWFTGQSGASVETTPTATMTPIGPKKRRTAARALAISEAISAAFKAQTQLALAF